MHSKPPTHPSRESIDIHFKCLLLREGAQYLAVAFGVFFDTRPAYRHFLFFASSTASQTRSAFSPRIFSISSSS